MGLSVARDPRRLGLLSNPEQDKNKMALKDHALEFDVDDAVLLMETPIHFDQKDKVTKAASAGRANSTSSSTTTGR